MKNIKVMLFEFKKSLTYEQLEECKIIQNHMDVYENFSEKNVVKSLNEHLEKYNYDSNIKGFLESLKSEIKENSLVYELKDLYKRVENKNTGGLYNQPLSSLFTIITDKDDDDSRLEAVLNELPLYDWIPEFKQFLLNINGNPIERENYKNTGKASKVYTIVERCEEGDAVWVCDRWLMIGESDIKQINIDDYIKDEDRRKEIRILENAIKYSTISDDKINFKIDEHLKISISTNNGNDIYMNDEKLESESTLEAIFNSPLVTERHRGNYMMLETTKNNVNKFAELDIALKVENVLNPFTENICFDFKDKIYMYSVDKRTGSKFYEYNNASEIIRDVQKEMDYDLSTFLENKLSDDLKVVKKLENQEKNIEMKLGEVHETVALLIEDEELFNECKELGEAYEKLNNYKEKLTKELNSIKGKKIEAQRSLINK